MMLETGWTIPADDGAMIFGRQNFCLGDDGQTPAGTVRVVVIVHGLTGNMNEYLHKSAALFFARHGYDVIRFNLYGEDPGARRLRDCTLETHAADLRSVLAHQAKSYSDIFVTGHSYGGPTVMLANPDNIRAASLWDPSFDLPRLWSLLPAHQENGYWIEGRGLEHLLNPAMMAEVPEFDRERCLSLARAAHFPVQVIHAEHCIYNAPDEISWHSAGHPDNERHLVMGADHCFHDGDTVDQMLAHSLRWFNRFSLSPSPLRGEGKG